MKTFQDGDPLFGVMMNAIANLWPNGTSVLSGCTQTGSGAARQITVAAGSVIINGTVRSVSQQTKTLDAAAFDRYDLISVNTSGTVVVTKGTEERRVPALPANSAPVAVCLIEAGQTTLPADRIYDTRMDALRLSVLNIDADKNWGGKNINNVNMLTVNKIKATSYLWTADPGLVKPRYTNNTLIRNPSKSWSTVKTTPAAKIGVLGAATIYYDITNQNKGGSIRLLKNDVVVPNSEITVTSGSSYLVIDVPITTGDIFKLQLAGKETQNDVYNTNFGIYALMTPIIDETETWS